MKQLLKRLKERLKEQKGQKKQRKQKKQKEPQKQKECPKKSRIFSIRNKILICFLVPLGFMIIIGISAYRKAESGMSQRFQESTLQTVKMATAYVDMSCQFIEAEGMKYAFDRELNQYFKGSLSDPIVKNEMTSRVQSEILSSQTVNPFIHNIYIVTEEGTAMPFSKTGRTMDGFFQEYRDSVSTDGKLDKWIDRHEVLDQKLGYEAKEAEEYILAYEILAEAGNAGIVIDLKSSVIQDFLQKLDMGKDGLIAFITPNGREIVCRSTEPENGSLEAISSEAAEVTENQVILSKQPFWGELAAAPEMEGSQRVELFGEDYFLIYSKSEETGAVVCAMVRCDTVTAQAQEIKSLTMGLVSLACAIVLCIGFIIVVGIQNNMKRISRKFGEVAKGDLTVQVSAKGHDEFVDLADSASHMIRNTKKLVNKVSDATHQLADSAQSVDHVSGIIDTCSQEITDAIGDINTGMEKQAQHAQECVAKTDSLSKEMQKVAHVVAEVEALVNETNTMIWRGMEIIRSLGEKAQETTTITAEVRESIEALCKESETINAFVETITNISTQTNLLSLNASIEAARAGQMGRGFAVVAEEIRDLASDSAKAAGEIRNNVENISAQTMRSVKSAEQAGTMVHMQGEAVSEVTTVFEEMQQRMEQLVSGLTSIVNCTEQADAERKDTVLAVKSISDIMEENAVHAGAVHGIAERLLENVDKLNHTSATLNENMKELESEITVFII